MNLHLFDCSNYIYAGASRGKEQPHVTRGIRESNMDYTANTAPIGGVRYFINELEKYTHSDAVLMPVIDSTPTIKRKMYYDLFGLEFGYKGNRPAPPEYIPLQKEYLYEVLKDCNFLVQRAEGYESDDLIYTLTKMYKDDFDKVYIHTRDSDLSFLVSDNVEIAKVGDLGKCIDMSNYGERVNRDSYVFYNTILFHKLYGGDTSDNIPGIGWDWASRIDSIIPSEDYNKLGDLDLSRDYLRKASIKYADFEKSHTLTSVFNIIAPLDVPEDFLDTSEQDINYDKFYKYYVPGWNANADVWGCEALLEDYINRYYD